MGQYSYVEKVASKLSHFSADAVGSWFRAIGLANQGKYGANELCADLVTNSAKGVELLLGLMTAGGAPLLPTVSINEAVGTIKSKGTSGTACLENPLINPDPTKPPPVLNCTNPLVLLGQTADVNPILAAVAFSGSWPEEFVVTVKAKDPKGSDPTIGLYAGGVFDPAGALVATILVNAR